MSELNLNNYAVWVLFPRLETEDPNLQYYYDFDPAKEEYARVFKELNCPWQWRSVSMQTVDEVLDTIERESGSLQPLVINLCDGDEINGVPGIGVVRALESRKLCYTGAREFFYQVTTSKIPMKEAFDAAGVATAPWCAVFDDTNLDEVFTRCEGSPIIVKPAVSGGSMGISVRNVVHTVQELHEVLSEMRKGYHGWDLRSGGILAERFIAGREFTTFIVGSKDTLHVYHAVERVFHESLKDDERFLSFDRLWETYETESSMPDNGYVYTYAAVEDELSSALKELSMKAYAAVQGTGYGRLDIRMDQHTGKLYVLEVNAQCGLSEDENYTSIGAILRFEAESFGRMTLRIMQDAIQQYEARNENRVAVSAKQTPVDMLDDPASLHSHSDSELFAAPQSHSA